MEICYSFPSLFIFRYHIFSYMRSGYAPNVSVYHLWNTVSTFLMYELFWPKWCLLVFNLKDVFVRITNEVGTVKGAIEKGKSNAATSKYQDTSRTNHYSAQDNDDFISSESDRQLLLMRQQDEELDELSESVQRIGGVGLTIHEELSGQERILNDLSLETETTSNRLDFVQKRVAMVMKKAGIKGQIMLIAFLVVLFIILFVLVFLT
ncbi:unnamed protein product [Miscanthus lutarioriparius]|uniref:t-SNARE coiled-coil homology domain-containing protein n=1 Tax=Miscanthus lutarioriparius TaxID=422564 RepID=A0A811P147_9POAL|nr:unnamed protein product [Miscanthus lutarioriparius]